MEDLRFAQSGPIDDGESHGVIEDVETDKEKLVQMTAELFIGVIRNNTEENQRLFLSQFSLLESGQVNKFFEALPEISDEDKELIPPNVARAIMEKELEQKYFSLLYSSHILTPHQVVRKDENELTLADRVLVILLELAPKYPNTVPVAIDQFPFEIVNPKFFIKKVVDIVTDLETDEYFIERLLHVFNYHFAFYKRTYEQEVVNNLDFINSDNFYRTAQFLEFLRRVYSVGSNFDFSTDGINGIREIIKQKVNEGEGSYLLIMRAKELLSVKSVYRSDFGAPVKINGRLVMFDNTTMNIALPDGRGYQRVLKPEDLDEFLVLGNERVKQDDLLDYSYLIRNTTRREIEKDFGVEVMNLPIREQFYFLNYVKSKNTKEFDKVREFSRKFGMNGIRMFLSLRYDSEIAEKMIDFANENPEKAKEVFERYASLVDESVAMREVASEWLNSNDVDIPTDVKNALPAYISEAIVRRSSDLLRAVGETYRSEEAQSTIEDTLISLRSVEFFFKMIANSDVPERFEFERRKNIKEDSAEYVVKDIETGFEYELKLFFRPEADEDGQARLNIELCFSDKSDPELRKAFEQEIVYKKDKKTKHFSRMRIALDLDEINGTKRVSLDFGRAKYSGEKIERGGDVLGNTLAKGSPEGSHTFDSFPIGYSDPIIFKKIVLAIKSHIKG